MAKPTAPWLEIEKMDTLLQLEPAVVIVSLAVSSWIIYKLLLQKLSEERHKNLQTLFRNLLGHSVILAVLYTTYVILRNLSDVTPTVERLSSYVGLITLASGATVFVKTWRILVFEYLFLGNMKVGVPVLLVNLSTLLLSMMVCGWFLTEIFNVRLAPLLATSAIFSIVLGLALQDTLGNLFAGVALQFDKPYEIGDWIELFNNGQKWIGQVHEISWRATVLVGISDEFLTIPNRIVGQSEIANFSIDQKPIARSVMFKIPHEHDPELVKAALLEATAATQSISKEPESLVFISEVHESWLLYRLIYFIDDYGKQWRTNDLLHKNARTSLNNAGIPFAAQRVQILPEQSGTADPGQPQNRTRKGSAASAPVTT